MRGKVRASAYARALARLARRDHSEQELRRLLTREGYSKKEIAGTLERLRERGFVNDLALAARFARSRMAHQGLGRHRVRQALVAKGVARREAEAGLTAALAEVSESQLIEDVARHFWRQRLRDEPRLRLRKLWAFLLRRGFPAGLVGDRLRALWPRYQAALEGLEPLETPES